MIINYNPFELEDVNIDNLRSRYEYTLSEYLVRFKESPPSEIWPDNFERFMDSISNSKCSTVEVTVYYETSGHDLGTDAGKVGMSAIFRVSDNLKLSDILDELKTRKDFPVEKGVQFVHHSDGASNDLQVVIIPINSKIQDIINDSSAVHRFGGGGGGDGGAIRFISIDCIFDCNSVRGA